MNDLPLHADSSLTCNAAWPQPIANGQRDVILCTDVQDLVPVHVGKILCVVQQTQLQADSSTSEGLVREQVGMAPTGLHVMQQAQLQALRIPGEAARSLWYRFLCKQSTGFRRATCEA